MKSTKFYRNAAMLLLAGATIIPQCLAAPAMAAPAAKDSEPTTSCAVKKEWQILPQSLLHQLHLAQLARTR